VQYTIQEVSVQPVFTASLKTCIPYPGHYHAHHDSIKYTPRYLALFYFLRDVEEGGETAFPLADDYEIPESEWNNNSHTPEGYAGINRDVTDRWNLSVQNCRRKAFVEPKQGGAILYSHLSAICPANGQQWGCQLGQMDPYSINGGCDVRKDVEWAANNW
jgi:hypoxia-inducible factor prolyl 4-hydroxylase